MMWGGGWNGTGFWPDWTGMLMMGFFSLLFIGGFILLLVWVIRSMTASGHVGPPGSWTSSAQSPDASEAIARERFARGEISQEEYESIVSVLRGR